MTNEEVNRVIALFMGWEKMPDGRIGKPFTCAIPAKEGVKTETLNWRELDPVFTDSLDALVPVWEKLEYIEFRCDWLADGAAFTFYVKRPFVADGKTIQEAAAHATAKCIKEIDELEKGMEG